MRKVFRPLCILMAVSCFSESGFLLHAQQQTTDFKVIGFFTAENDRAHISFVHEANQWFEKTARQHPFSYDSTRNWHNLHEDFLKQYDVVLFLDTRPEAPEQRKAFPINGLYCKAHFNNTSSVISNQTMEGHA